jgi:hypothetical protein
MTERLVNSTLRTLLLNNEEFDYCHLIKFERPSLPDSLTGKVSTSKERYTYITDASMDVSYDDGSTSLSGVPNGAQTFVANKVMKVGSVSEDSEAKATTFNIDLDGTSIGAYVTATVDISVVSTGVYDIKFPRDIVEEGFREGDKITITGNSTPGDYNVHSFRTNNVLRVTKIDTTMSAQASVAVAVSLASEEIKSILLDKNSDGYASFINREVYVWKAFFQNGAVVGAPVLIFKGLISNVSFEDSETAVKVSWGMTSHWGDWSQVAGRITSDDFHRALDSNGNPNPLSALKPLYAYDKGFIHAETSINLLANYTTLVEKQDVSVKKSFFGLSSKVKVKKYLAPETRSTELDFQLQAKSLPLIYGVRPVSGIPIFADTLLNDSSTVYVVYALSEGEISSIYDVHIEGNSLICSNKADYDARAVQTADNTVSLVCMGRADRGDVLGGAVATSGSPISYYTADSYLYDLGYNLIDQVRYTNYVEPVVTAPVTSTGIKDGETLTLTSPQQIVLDFFSGKEAQKASQSLVNIAKSGNFKIQNDYWAGTDTAEYWGPNHRLLDTAYVVAKYKIAEGETTIPTLQFIINGKVIPCYNYDYSYSQYAKASGESEADFKLGASVDVYRSDTNALIDSGLQIIDKWTLYNPDGTANVRFRLSSPPSLGYVDGVPSITKFHMKIGANTWTMVTYNHKEHSGSPAAQITSTISGASDSGGKVAVTYSSNTSIPVGGDPLELSAKYAVLSSSLEPIDNERFGNSLLSGTATSTTLTTEYSYSTNNTYASSLTGNKIVAVNTIKLAAGASSTADYYKGYDIVVTKTDSTTGKQIVQKKTVIAYDGTTKIATIDGVWDVTAIPNTSDTYYLTQSYIDSRSTNNFAMQLLDYSTSLYGRNLDLESDIDFSSWLASARSCDTRSDVTVRLAPFTSAPSVGAVYKTVNTAGDIIWQGTVASSYTSSVPGTSTEFVTFTDVIGKLSNLWNSWKAFKEGEIVYYGNNVYKVTSGYTASSTPPTHTSGTVGNLAYQITAGITKVSGTGASSLLMHVGGNPVQGIKNGRLASGYSLYDSDGVDYWKYLGWWGQEQRYVTKHQGNMSIDTSQPIFDNTNSILSHFGGILRYSSGKYYLDVEEQFTGTILASDPYNITEDDIIGKISLTDEGIRGAYNSLAVSYADPSNKFEARNISFFNSEYLKADRNVARKGNLAIPGITNYYNGRLLADKYLNKSRFGLTISLTIRPKGILLVPGNIMQLQYSRYGWVDKKFRIESLTISEDCLVDIVASEYDDSFYAVSNISRQNASGVAGLPVSNSFAAPTALSAANIEDNDDTTVTINLTWLNSDTATPIGTSTEVYHTSKDVLCTGITSNVVTSSAAHNFVVGDVVIPFSTSNGLTSGTSYYVATVPTSTTFTLKNAAGTTITLTNGTGLGIWVGAQKLLTVLSAPINKLQDIVYSTNSASKYYRIRHRVALTNVSGITVDNYSEYYPTLASTAVLGTTDGAPPAITGVLTRDSVALPASSGGTVSSYSTATGTFNVYSDGTLLSSGVTFSVIGTSSATGTINSSTGVYSVTAISADTASITVQATTAGVSISKIFTLTKAKAGTNGSNGTNGTNGTNGIDGAPGIDGTDGADAVSITMTNSSASVIAYADGSVPSFTGMDGTIKVYSGSTDVTASSTFSSTSSGLTGTVNTATNTPVTGARGYYRVTAMSADQGTLTISIVYNSVTYTRVFSVTKNKTGYEIVSTLPSTNLFVGRMVYLTSDNKLYRYNGSSFVTNVPATDVTGTLVASQIGSGIIDHTKIANGLGVPLIVGKVNINDGTVTSPVGAGLAYNYQDGKMYRNSDPLNLSTTWEDIFTSASYITGTLTNAQIASLAASKITGQLTNTQIADLAAAKISGQLTNAQLADIAAAKITGTLSDSQLAAISAAKITGQITSTQITDNSVTTAKINAGAVTTAKLTADAVTANEIAANAVTAVKINAGAVTAGKIAADAVTANEIAANAVTAVKISAGAITTAKIAADAVTANEIAANAITTAKLSAGAVTAAKITAGTITSTEIATDTITANNIQANAIGASELAANSVIAGKIAAGVVTAAEIAAGAVSASKMSIGSLDNLLVNPNSEYTYASGDGAAGVYNAGAANAYNGSYVRRIVSPTSAETNIFIGEVPCQPGARFYSEAYCKSVSGSPNTGIYMYFKKEDGTVLAGDSVVHSQVSPATGTYQKSSIAGTAPALASTVGWYLYVTAAAGTVYFDGLYARRMLAGSLIVDGTITAANIQADTITASQIASGTITTSELSAGAVTAAKIAANTITAAEIASGTITAAKLSVSTLSAITADIGTMTAGVIRNSASTFGINANASVVVTFAGSYMKITGAGFGASGDLMEWWGLTPSGATITDPKLSTLTKTNAVWALGTNGKAYYKGSALSSQEIFSNVQSASTGLSTNNTYMTLAYEHSITIPADAKLLVQFNSQVFFPSTGDMNLWLVLNPPITATTSSGTEILSYSGGVVPDQTYLRMKNSGTYEMLAGTNIVLDVTAGTHKIGLYGNQITGGTATIKNTSTIITAVYS